jgi:hypothetical protein
VKPRRRRKSVKFARRAAILNEAGSLRGAGELEDRQRAVAGEVAHRK